MQNISSLNLNLDTVCSMYTSKQSFILEYTDNKSFSIVDG